MPDEATRRSLGVAVIPATTKFGGDRKFKGISIQDALLSRNIGEIPMVLAASGTLVSDYSDTVFVFRELPPGSEETARMLGIHVGGAYGRKGSDKYIFIKDVDLEKSDDELAREFGVR